MEALANSFGFMLLIVLAVAVMAMVGALVVWGLVAMYNYSMKNHAAITSFHKALCERLSGKSQKDKT